MRSVVVSVLIGSAMLGACGAKYKPANAALSSYERSFKFPVNRPHEGLVYSGAAPATSAPVPPVMAFGAAFDLDFVVIPKAGEFDMLEFAKLATPTGPQWLALETSAQGGDQTLVANVDDIESFMPEIPLTRLDSNDFVATDKSTEFTVDLTIDYTNSRGQKVHVTMVGDPPTKTARKRNGRTFDHSANQLLAVLDVESTQSLFKANVDLDDHNLKLKKIAAIVPAQFVLVQSQGGLAQAAFKVIPTTAAAGSAELGKVVVNAPGEAPAAKPAPDLLVKMAVVQNVPALTKCWSDRVAEKADLSGGPMTFAFRIDAGKVNGAKVMPPREGQAAFADEPLATCVTTALGTWSLDESVNATVNWPFTFVAGDDEAEPKIELGIGETIPDPEAAPAPAPVDPAPEAVGGTDGESLDGEFGGGAPAAVGEVLLSSFTTVHPLPGDKSLELQWLVSRQGDRVIARQTTAMRSLTYSYRLVQGHYLELVGITVEQYGRATPVTAITFNPPLPDIRWPFGGRRASSFVIDVNGQESLSYGDIEAYWTESGPKVKVTPAEPSWAKSRPMLTSVTYPGDGTAEVRSERTGE